MVIVTSGLDQAKEFAMDYFDNFTFMAIGTGNSAELPSSTGLDTEIVRDPIDVTVKTVSTGVYDFTATFELSDASGSTIKEAAIFNASTSGQMGFRKVLPVEVSLDGTQQLKITLRVSVSAINSGDTSTLNFATNTGDNLVTNSGDNLVIQN